MARPLTEDDIDMIAEKVLTKIGRGDLQRRSVGMGDPEKDRALWRDRSAIERQAQETTAEIEG